MKNLLIPASLVAAAILPTAAQAQAVPPAIVAVVDLEKVTAQCNACKTAQTALNGQVTTLRSRATALSTPLQAEEKSLQAAIDALGGKEPDAALKTRVQTFQTRQQQAAQDLQRQQQQLQLNQQYVSKQITDKLGPIYSQVMQRRGANLMVEINQTLASGATLDVTNDVVTALNASLTSLQTVARAQAQQARPQGR
jgi:outer membrane protein